MAWFFLILAGLSEIVWAYGLKMTHGFTDLQWSVITIIFMIVSFFLFAKSMKEIPIGTAYAVFTGIGAAGTAIIGIILLGEEVNAMKIASLLILITGIVGLKLVGEANKKGKEDQHD